MQIYLPIADVSVDVILILGLGAAVGYLSGLFGVGGGFLLTPLLMVSGIPPTIAVPTVANQIVATSASSVVASWRRGGVDFRLGGVLLVSGVVGSAFGVWLFGVLRSIGQIDFVIQASYVVFLGVVGSLMVIESVRFTLRRPGMSRSRLNPRTVFHRLPLRVRFRQSRLYVSIYLPVGLGFLSGVLGAILGVGGGFFLVPALIYLLGMPVAMVPGTALFQTLFVTATVTFLQATNHQTVDIVLALILILGGVVGAQLGTRTSTRLKGEDLRALMGILVLLVCAWLLYTLILPPKDMFSIATGLS